MKKPALGYTILYTLQELQEHFKDHYNEVPIYFLNLRREKQFSAAEIDELEDEWEKSKSAGPENLSVKNRRE